MLEGSELACDICGSHCSVDPGFSCPVGDPCCATAVCDAHEGSREQIHIQRGCIPASSDKSPTESNEAARNIPDSMPLDFYYDYVYLDGQCKDDETIVGRFGLGNSVITCRVDRAVYCQLADEGYVEKRFRDFVRYKALQIISAS